MDVVGLDISIGALGIAVFRMGSRNMVNGDWVQYWRLVDSCVVAAPGSDGTDTDKGERLYKLGEAVAAAIRETVLSRDDSKVFCEGYAFSRPQGARRIAESHGAVHASVYGVLRRPISYVAIMDAKKVACPSWRGWSKSDWAASGHPGKYKYCMPEKQDVINGMWERFRLQFATDAEADAASVAIHGISRGNSSGLRFIDVRGGNVPSHETTREEEVGRPRRRTPRRA